MDRIRETLSEFIPIMWQEQYTGPSQDFICVMVQLDFADSVIERVTQLLQTPGIVTKLPVTPAEITMYSELLCSGARRQICRDHAGAFND